MSIAQVSAVNQDSYEYRQQQKALAHAPAGPVSEADFRRELLAYSLPVIRQASVHWRCARGSSYSLVIDRFVQYLGNPHLNPAGDDFRVALGMVRYIDSEKARWGIAR